MHEKII